MEFILNILFASHLTSQAFSEEGWLTRANNEFALKLHKTFPPTENAFHSPASIFIALGMLYRGARGLTAREMQETLSYDITTQNNESIHQEFAELLRMLKSPLNEYKFEIANAIVTSSNFPISEEYIESLKIYYCALSKEVDFRADKTKAIKEINNWVSEKTNGKIPYLLDNLDDNMVMVLLNAVYFKGIWKTQFSTDNTIDDVFYAHGINAKPVRMMNEQNDFYYQVFWKNKFQCLKMPYKGEHISMIIILPLESNTLGALEETLTSEMLIEVISSLKKNRVTITIPKFKLEDNRKLNESLKRLGMQTAFVKGLADFSGIERKRSLFVSDVVHKAVVEVNEEGSEAAAATGVIANSRSGFYTEFRADRPFLFFIWDERIKMILFMGRINQL